MKFLLGFFLAMMLLPGVAIATPGDGLTVPAIQLSSLRGKPLIINVWASWCGPCRAEMGSLDKLAKRYKGKPFKVIGISTDDYPEKAYDFLPVGFENFIDARLELENMLGADRLPLTLLIDAQGKVLAKHYGARDWDSAETRQMIAKAFGLKL
jgi:thiol-disulfide isomerase/thioredoxin